MPPEEFIKKHNLNLSSVESQLLWQGMYVMENAKDVHHGVSHIYRLIFNLDEFVNSEEYKSLPPIDLKVLFLATVWHDCWRSQKDPKTALGLWWYTVLERYGAPRAFLKAAKRSGLPKDEREKISYIIKKHVYLESVPIKFHPRKLEYEVKILRAVDILDGFSDERIAVIERKFLLERPITNFYLKQAKFAVKFFVAPNPEAIFYFSYIQKRIMDRKNAFLKRVLSEITEYEQLLKLKQQGKSKEYNDQLEIMKQKYATK